MIKREFRVLRKGHCRLADLHDNARVVVATLCLAFAMATRAQAQFEGIVETKNISTDEMGRPQEFVMTMWVKKDMVRIETRGATMPASTMIYRTDMRKIFMLNDDERSYFEISQDERGEELYAAGGTTAKYTTKRTGKAKKIAGYPCQEFIIKRGNEVTQLWGTKKLGHLVSAISKALGQEHAQVVEGPSQEAMKLGIYPMSSSTRLNGNMMESQEVTKVETTTLDTMLFELPAGYKKQKTVDMMRGLQEERK